MCSCRFKFTWDCDEEIPLFCDRSISSLWNRIIAQQEISLTFTANQELIRRSNFRDDISHAHIVCTRQEKDLAILSVSHCIVYFNSFRYDSSRCSGYTLPVLHHAIRHSFSFAPAPPFAWFLFSHITRNATHGTAQYSSCRISKMCTYAVRGGPLHQITKYNGNCKRHISHQSNTDHSPVYFF